MRLKYQNGFIFEGHTFVVDKTDIRNAKDERFVEGAALLPEAHGRWEHLDGDEWICTACGHVISTEGSWDFPAAKYCEECGARMDGGEGE